MSDGAWFPVGERSEPRPAEAEEDAPIRLLPHIAAKVRECAAADGLTPDGWVRLLVRKELEHRGLL